MENSTLSNSVVSKPVISVRFFDPGQAYKQIKPQIDAEMQRVLAAGDLILRKDVDDFEKNLAAYLGVKYVASVASGTDALELSLKAAGIGFGSIVLAPSYTFRATVEAIQSTGALVELYDLGETPQYWKADAIVVAHIAGELMYPPDMPDDFLMIEDSCQAISAGPLRGKAACYSFYPAKILGCYGDGGAVATNDARIYSKIKYLRNHCKGDWKGWGTNSRLDNIQAAVLNVKLKYLPDALVRRKQIALQYDRGLMGVGLPSPRMVYQDYIITHPHRDILREYLAERFIETMDNGYPFPDGAQKGPKTLEYERISLRLPIYPELADEQVQYVIDTINAFSL